MQAIIRKTNNLARAAGTKAARITKSVTVWSKQEIKQGYAAYMQWAEEKARHLEQTKAERVAQAKRKADAEAIAAQERRQRLHDKIHSTLGDDFNVLEYDLTGFVASRPLHERKAIITKYLGQGSRLQFGGNAMESTLNVTASVIKGGVRMKYESDLYAIMRDGHFMAMRSVSDMHEREIGLLKMLATLNVKDVVKDEEVEYALRSIAFNAGTCMLQQSCNRPSDPSSRKHTLAVAVLSDWMRQVIRPPALVAQEAIIRIGGVRKQIQDPALASLIDQELKGTAGW